MRDEAHKHFLRWGAWVLEPVPGESHGYGKNILQRIVEGRGVLLPGSPEGSGLKRITSDPVASYVDNYVRHVLVSEERRMIREYYLNPYRTVEERAQRARMAKRTLYDRLDRIHARYLAQRCSDGL